MSCPINNNSSQPSNYYLLPKKIVDEYKMHYNYNNIKNTIDKKLCSDYNRYKSDLMKKENSYKSKENNFFDINPIDKDDTFFKFINKFDIKYPNNFFPIKEDILSNYNIDKLYLYELIIGSNQIFILDKNNENTMEKKNINYDKKNTNILVCSITFENDENEDIDDFVVNVDNIMIYVDKNILKKEMDFICKNGFEEYCKKRNIKRIINEESDIYDNKKKIGICFTMNNKYKTPSSILSEYVPTAGPFNKSIDRERIKIEYNERNNINQYNNNHNNNNNSNNSNSNRSNNNNSSHYSNNSNSNNSNNNTNYQYNNLRNIQNNNNDNQNNQNFNNNQQYNQNFNNQQNYQNFNNQNFNNQNFNDQNFNDQNFNDQNFQGDQQNFNNQQNNQRFNGDQQNNQNFNNQQNNQNFNNQQNNPNFNNRKNNQNFNGRQNNPNFNNQQNNQNFNNRQNNQYFNNQRNTQNFFNNQNNRNFNNQFNFGNMNNIQNIQSNKSHKKNTVITIFGDIFFNTKINNMMITNLNSNSEVFNWNNFQNNNFNNNNNNQNNGNNQNFFNFFNNQNNNNNQNNFNNQNNGNNQNFLNNQNYLNNQNNNLMIDNNNGADIF